ncbi:MAG TPA: M12 family metallo-peptidase, partial [Pyrinomonadaceae bacterium]|nr:M12 family metallo-peptidase [Pyrinomonadaceae bacterium]
MKKLASLLFTFFGMRSLLIAIITAFIVGSLTVTALMQNGRQTNGNNKASQDPAGSDPTAEFWQESFNVQPSAPGQDAAAGPQIEINARKFRALSLNRDAMQRRLATAPREFTAAARQGTFLLSLPTPAGTFQRFAVRESPVMEPALAAKHPEIKTYFGTGIEDPTANIRFDLTPLGFHAAVRGQLGSWYIDPYYHLDQSVYVSYFRGDLENPHGAFTELPADEALISADHSFYRVGDTAKLNGTGFGSRTTVNVTIADEEGQSGVRNLTVQTDETGSFELKFPASGNGSPSALKISAVAGDREASATYDVVARLGKAPLVATGDQLRTYRLALITDPGYAAYVGAGNVTAAKVALINRVDQLYEADISIRLVLIANNDLLNLDTWDQAVGPNGPCGAAGCFTQAQVTGCASTTRARFVIGQIIGASNYDIGHLALGQPGGGVANLGVVGRSNKAGGCTGIPTPVGDFYAVDYVAHEMGHQFSGNHPFNGNQLNCSGGNRNAATSTEPGSGSSVMAYAGICLTDDLQRHSDPYFSQRSQQEIATYTSSAQTAINEVQTASLLHFGGGTEVQVVTFGPGYAPAFTVRPTSVATNAAPSSTSLGGAEEVGNTVTIATGNAHTAQVGDVITITGMGVAGYNGTWTVTAVPTSRSLQYTNPTAGLATSGGGTITFAEAGAAETGTVVTIRTSAVHGRAIGDIVTMSGVGVAGYNGTFTITGTPSTRTFQYTAVAGLATSGGGTATFNAPFQVRIGGNDSAVIGTVALPYTSANVQTAINGIAGFAGTVAVSGAAATGFTVTYGGATAGVDVPNIQIVNLSCGGCFSSVQETNHGGSNDSFTLNYNGNVSAPIVNGTNFSAAGISAALAPILPAGATATVAGFAGGGFNNTGFQVTFTGTFAATNVPIMLALQNFSSGASGFVNETDKGGAVDNKGGTITATGNAIPVVTAPATFTIPLRTPFALTGSASDANGDTLTYSWEQNDRGGTNGTSLLSNTKTNGPLFAMFPFSGQISDADSLLYNSPGENHLTTNPTRVFPDLQQILDNNTNAATGACPTGPIASPVPVSINECFAEFLPTIDYVGVAGTNATPLSLNFRFTARDGKGGVDSANTAVLIDNTAGPLRVTSQSSFVGYNGLSNQTVTWDVNNTNTAQLAPNVKISLSVDGGHVYPFVLLASTPNDGSEIVTLPDTTTAQARIKVEAVNNIFFDVNHSNFAILSPSAAPAFISGKITTPDGAPLAGVTLNLSGARNAKVITDAAGNYRFNNVDTENFYT